MHHSRNDDVIDVAENFLEWLAFFGCALGELLANSAGLVVRRNAQSFDVFAEIRNPVREFMQLFAEFLRRRVTEAIVDLSSSFVAAALWAAPTWHDFNISVPRFPHGSGYSLKRKAETEVERAEIFELVRVRIDTVVEANRADRQLVTQTSTNRVAHVVQPDVLRRRQQIASISKYGALQFAENWECIFNVEDGKKFSADWMTMIIMRAEIALGEAAHGRGAAIEKPFVDGNRSCLVGAAAR